MGHFINSIFTFSSFFPVMLFCLLSLMPFAILGYLFSKHLDRKPSFLISFDRMRDLENAWTLLLVITAPLVFIYNVFVWAGWAFVIIANFIAGIMKRIYDYLIYDYIITPVIKAIKWIVNALIWLFINALWIPITIIFKLLYHYIILWPWDLYLSSFNSLKNTFNKTKIKVGFLGSFYSITIMGLCFYLSVLTEAPVIAIIGIIIGLLPTIRAHGTITSMIHSDKDEEDHYLHGNKVMRTSLNYILIALGAIVLIHLLFFLSFIPDFGLIILGIGINANVFFSGIIILSLIVLLFSKSLIPNHLLHNDESTAVRKSLSNYLSSVKEKGLQLLFSMIPGIIWSSLILIIPVLFIYLSMLLAGDAKTRMLTERSYEISEKIQESEYKLLSCSEKNIEEQLKHSIKLELENIQNEFSLDYPENIITNPAILFNSNTNKYTNILPYEFKESIEDTIILHNIIFKQNAEIITLKKYFNKYKYENWHFIIERRIRDLGAKEWRVVSVAEDITEYIDDNVEEGKSYEYRLKAVNSEGSSKWSPIFRRTIGKTTVSAPSRLRVSRERNFRHILKWNDNSYNEEGFSIQRKESKESEWKIIASVSADKTIYIDKNINTGTTYDYRVFAITNNLPRSKTLPTNTIRFTAYLNHPYSVSTIANLKSILIDWQYNFRYPENRKKGKITTNKDIEAFSHQETSFSDDLKAEIENREDLLKISKDEMIIAKKLINIYASLIDYEEKMRFQLKVFKNITFLFALLFIALFIGIILSILISYVTTLFYNAYNIRDNESWYFMSLVRDVRSKNKNQPLLGFTLLPILLLLFFGGSVAFQSIPNNAFDLDLKFNIPIQKEILEDEKSIDLTSLDYTFDLGERNQHDNYFILLSLFQDEEDASHLVDSLTMVGYLVKSDFLPHVSSSKEKSYLVYLGPYFPKAEANQWVKILGMDPSHIIKTMKVSDSDNKEEIDQEDQDIDSPLIFKVQIGVYKQGSKLNDERFIAINAKEENINNTYTYFVGNTPDTTTASRLKEEMIEKGFTDAFVVAYMEGVRVKY